MKTEYTSPVRAMRSNPPQYFVISVNENNVLDTGENELWRRKGIPLKNISPSSDDGSTLCNSLTSQCIPHIGGSVNKTWNCDVSSEGYDFLSLADKLYLKSKLEFRIPYNKGPGHNSISEFGISNNSYVEFLASKCKGGAI